MKLGLGLGLTYPLFAPAFPPTSSGFDLSLTFTYSGNSFFLGNESSQNKGMVWNSDGTKFFTVGATAKKVFEYHVSAAFNLGSIVSYSGNFADVGGEDTNPSGLAWNNDGTKFFIVGANTDIVFEYSVSVGFDLSSIVSYSGNFFDASNESGISINISWNNDGTKLFVASITMGRIFEYSVSAAFDLSSTILYSGNFLDVTNEETNVRSFAWNNDGTKIFAAGAIAKTVFEYHLSVGFDLGSVVSYSGFFSNVSNENDLVASFVWNNDGTKFFTVDLTSEQVFEYHLNEPSFPFAFSKEFSSEFA